MTQVLFVCYFLALVAALGKVLRYAVDATRTKQSFYLIGVPANMALACALILIAGSAGDKPFFSGEWLRFSVRLAFILWACFALLFEMCYLRTFLTVCPPTDEKEESNE